MVYIVIMAGGIGQRFWPYSSPSNPKQCQRIWSKESLYQSTVKRALKLVSPEQVFVVTSATMQQSIASQTESIPLQNILVEPSGRNTAPSLALAARKIITLGGGTIIVWPSDHEIIDEDDWLNLHRDAVPFCGEDKMVIVGIKPTRPATGFGYIRFTRQNNSHIVNAFVEKPDLQTALKFVESNSYMWNAGVLVAHTSILQKQFEQHLPQTWSAICTDDLRHNWNQTERVSIDQGILEKTSELWMFPFHGGWSDMGTWDAIGHKLNPKEGNNILAQSFVSFDSHGCTVVAPNRNVQLLGVRDLIIVNGPDGLLIMDPKFAQKVTPKV